MRYVSSILLMLFFSISCVQAATCRSGDAATRGSKVGYEQDKQAAEQNAQNERAASDILGKCVGAINAVITVPQFPSLSGIFDQIINKVCKIASDQVNGAINAPVNEINSQINGEMNNINGQINNTGIGQVVQNVPQITGSGTQIGTNPSQKSQFWSNIWK